MSDDYSSESGENFDDIFSPKLTRADVRDEVSKTLRDISTFNAQAVASQQYAMRELSAKHPDFEQRRPRMLATLEEIPLLRDAIGAAEANPQLAPTLPSLYEIAYRASQTPSDSNAAASEPSLETTQRPSNLDEDAMYQGALASQRVDLSPENRKSLLSELERKGVLDISF